METWTLIAETKLKQIILRLNLLKSISKIWCDKQIIHRIVICTFQKDL